MANAIAFCNLDSNCTSIYQDPTAKDFRPFHLPNCSLILKGPAMTDVYRKGENFKMKKGKEGTSM